jgi:hypothetical protein
LSEPKDYASIEARVRALKARGGQVAIGYADTFAFDFPGAEVTGLIADYRQEVGEYESDLIVLDEATDEAGVQVGKNGQCSVWLGADLQMKIRAEHVGRRVTIIYVDSIDVDMGNPMRAYEVIFHGAPTEAKAG